MTDKSQITRWLVRNVPERLLPVVGPLDLWARRIMAGKKFDHYKINLNGELFQALGFSNSILGGPFAGMQYLSHSMGSALWPKILGTYEMELHSEIESILHSAPPLILNIGTGEGYYAVGLALRLPESKVIGFEQNRYARFLFKTLVKKNGVHNRIKIEGEATSDLLNKALLADVPTCIFCDCEGAELKLLDPDLCPQLKACDILVETHHIKGTGVDTGVVLRERFSKTHEIRSTPSRLRTVKDVNLKAPIPEDLLLSLLDEDRPRPQEWLRMSPLRH